MNWIPRHAFKFSLLIQTSMLFRLFFREYYLVIKFSGLELIIWTFLLPLSIGLMILPRLELANFAAYLLEGRRQANRDHFFTLVGLKSIVKALNELITEKNDDELRKSLSLIQRIFGEADSIIDKEITDTIDNYKNISALTVKDIYRGKKRGRNSRQYSSHLDVLIAENPQFENRDDFIQQAIAAIESPDNNLHKFMDVLDYKDFYKTARKWVADYIKLNGQDLERN